MSDATTCDFVARAFAFEAERAPDAAARVSLRAHLAACAACAGRFADDLAFAERFAADPAPDAASRADAAAVAARAAARVLAEAAPRGLGRLRARLAAAGLLLAATTAAVVDRSCRVERDADLPSTTPPPSSPRRDAEPAPPTPVAAAPRRVFEPTVQVSVTRTAGGELVTRRVSHARGRDLDPRSPR